VSSVDVIIEPVTRRGPAREMRAGVALIPDVSGVPLADLGTSALDAAFQRVIRPVKDVPLGAKFGSAI
jgi:hypothetical protein